MAPDSSRVSAAMLGGKYRLKTPGSGRSCRKISRKSGSSSIKTKTQASASAKLMTRAEDNKLKLNSEPTTKTVESETDEESFKEHTDLCSRMAKTLYFANKLPSTPRPSLPLTMLAVNTFARSARKDTLEFLDVEMAAEIGRNACVSPTALIMALIYLERLSSHNPGYLNTIKPSELFVVSLLVASKFIQDDGEDLGIFNDEWATSAQLDLKKLNKLELQFLTAIDWRVNVRKGEYDKLLKRLESKLALDQGMRRGWFTYTELGNLTNTLLAWNLIWPTLYDYCIKVISAAYLTYATLIATMLTSSFMAPQIFFMTKAMMTANNIGTYSSLTTSPNICSNPVFTNSSAFSLPPMHYDSDQETEEGFSGSVETDEMILKKENETDVISSNLRLNMEHQFNYRASENMWKARMSAKSRIKLGLDNADGNINHGDGVCYQEWNRGSKIWNEETFTRIVKQFFNSNLEKRYSRSEAEGDEQTDTSVNYYGHYRSISSLKCIQQPKSGLPLYSMKRYSVA